MISVSVSASVSVFISTVFLLFIGAEEIFGLAREEDRIVGGEVSPIEERPYQLVFLFQNVFICGAALVKSDAALTAAHCVKLTDPEGREFSVRAGSSFLNFGGILMGVKRATVHPKFEKLDYDIAIVKLEESLPSTKKIRPIRIANDDRFIAGKMAEVSGWGVTIPFLSFSTSFILQATQLRIVTRSECKQYYDFISERMICAIGIFPFSDSCQGDSGGPLVMKNVLIGLVSFGKGCSEGIPGVYTDVTKFRRFINDNI